MTDQQSQPTASAACIHGAAPGKCREQDCTSRPCFLCPKGHSLLDCRCVLGAYDVSLRGEYCVECDEHEGDEHAVGCRRLADRLPMAFSGAAAASLPKPPPPGPLATGARAPRESDEMWICETFELLTQRFEALEQMHADHAQRQADIHGLTTGPTADRFAKIESFAAENAGHLAWLMEQAELAQEQAKVIAAFKGRLASIERHAVEHEEAAMAGKYEVDSRMAAIERRLLPLSPGPKPVAPPCHHGADLCRQRDDVTRQAVAWKERAEKAEADVESERNLAALWRGRATLALADLAQSQAECAALLRPQPESGPQAGTVTDPESCPRCLHEDHTGQWCSANVVTAPYGVIGHRVCGCAPTKEKP